jgi:anti-anti-sigma regulatory factor
MQQGKGATMIATGQTTIREGDLELSLQAEDKDFVYVTCQGAVSLPDFRPEKDPLLRLLGPEAYSHRLLFNLEQASMLDTSGISWLIHCHETCFKSGGILVLYAVPRRVRYVLQLLQMEHLFHMADDAASARALALKGGA